MRTIPLSQGKVALVNDEDYEYLSQWKWHAHHERLTWYALRNITRSDGTQRQIRMQNILMGPAQEERVDHIDGNGLDNQRSNLRIATIAQNGQNKGLSRANTSGYKGVVWNRERNRWRAQIVVEGRSIYLGSFIDLIEAAQAYDVAAQHHFGEFARLNLT